MTTHPMTLEKAIEVVERTDTYRDLLPRETEALRFAHRALQTSSDDLRDRAALWAHELAEIERVIAEKRGERNADSVGAPLYEIVAELLDEAYAFGRYDGAMAAQDAVTAHVVRKALYPGDQVDEAHAAEHAERVRGRLATMLGWPP